MLVYQRVSNTTKGRLDFVNKDAMDKQMQVLKSLINWSLMIFNGYPCLLKPQGSIDRLVGLVMKRSYWDKSLQRCAKVHNAGGIACTLFNHFFPEHQDCSNGNFMQFPNEFNWSCFYVRCVQKGSRLGMTSSVACWIWEDPWFPFITNALNAKELYIKDKAGVWLALFSASHWHTRGCWMPVKSWGGSSNSWHSKNRVIRKPPSDGSPIIPFPMVIKAYIVKRGEVMMLGMGSGCGHWGITESLAIETCKKCNKKTIIWNLFVLSKEQTNGHLSDFAIFLKLPNLALVYWTLV